MTKNEFIEKNRKLKENLKIDCSKCFGLCCVLLYFTKAEGFPYDKSSGVPCKNLCEDNNCKMHKELDKKGFRGCTTYECLGAGQKISQGLFKGQDWRYDSEIMKEMVDVFPKMLHLHEMLWYLSEALRMQDKLQAKEEIYKVIEETINITNLDLEGFKKVNYDLHRQKVNKLLLQTSEQIRRAVNKGKEVKLKGVKTFGSRINFMGKNLRDKSLRGHNLSGALLMSADLRGLDLTGTDLLGADLRDADLRDADLSNSIYLTQEQLNSTRGNMNTKIPNSLKYPVKWEKSRILDKSI